MWLQVATCILGSNEFRWASGQGMLPKAQLPAVSLSRVQLHTQASFSNLLSFRLLWKKMTSVVTYLTLCHQKLQWKSNQESNSTCEKQKPSLKKKKINPAKVSLYLFNWAMCPHGTQLSQSGDWTRLINTVLKLRWNQLLQIGGGGLS